MKIIICSIFLFYISLLPDKMPLSFNMSCFHYTNNVYNPKNDGTCNAGASKYVSLFS
jgi:hypothetical protein